MDFLDEVAAYAPVPAGGAAAAYTATLGMSLIYKVVLFELNRKELAPAPQANLRVAQKEIERLFHDLKKIVKEDPKCYEKFSQCARSAERGQMKSAFVDIVTCSMEVMEKSYQGLDWAHRLSKISAAGLAPHLRVAVELLSAALAATAHVVRDNTKRIKSEEKRVSYLKNLDELYQQGMAKRKELLDII
jgi:formiminotetrahydrofolate cyclodeaminase